MKTKPRIFIYDIETAPLVTYSWTMRDDRPAMLKKDWELLSFSYKELKVKGTTGISRADFADKTDRSLVKALRVFFEQADVLIGHNIMQFDTPKSIAKFAEHKLKPVLPMQIDTLRIARSTMGFSGNSLDALAQRLGLGRKMKHSGMSMWDACLEGKSSGFREMVKYNKADVDLTEKVYLRIRNYGKHSLSMALLESNQKGCPSCGSLTAHKKGFQVSEVSIRQSWLCTSCGHRFLTNKTARMGK
jgi:hypothetical protein